MRLVAQAPLCAQSGVLLPPTVSPKTNTGVQLGVDYVQNTGGRGKASHMHAGAPTPRASLTHGLRGCKNIQLDPLIQVRLPELH